MVGTCGLGKDSPQSYATILAILPSKERWIRPLRQLKTLVSLPLPGMPLDKSNPRLSSKRLAGPMKASQ